ncbi:MAG TPA: nuclear transport factor 2 family protein [Intrasporangium sp.]|nr:nuclear transport factor 2 family protein [Intrasporangium sp.]
MIRQTTRVAVLGLGRMGSAMAQRLAEQGLDVSAWSRKSRDVVGVDLRPSAIEAVRGAGVVILALFDGAACRHVLDQCLGAIAEDAVVVNTSTVGPDEATRLEQLVRDQSRVYLHAPVMGSGPAVRSGSLTVLAGSGAGNGVEAVVQGVIERLGTAVPCGDARTAAAVKLVANQVLGESIAALGRTLASGDALGVDRALVLDVLERTALGRIVGAKRPRLEGEDGPADFTTGALIKDIGLLASEVPAVGALLGALQAVRASPEDDVAALTRGLASGARSADTDARLVVDAGVCVDPDLLRPLVEYCKGHATGDGTHFRRAFRPTAHIEGIRDGVFTSWDLDTYCGLFTGHPAADEGSRLRIITGAGRAGSTAHATMRLEHGPAAFTDTFLLAQEGAEWRIVNKVYVHETRPS